MPLSVPSTASPNQFYLLASARSVDGNSLATTTLGWQNGASAANSIPMTARVLRKTGTFSLMIANLQLNSTTIQPISAASSVVLGAGADPLLYPLGTATSTAVVPIAGNWSVVVATINGTASTFDMEIWGFRIS